MRLGTFNVGLDDLTENTSCKIIANEGVESPNRVKSDFQYSESWTPACNLHCSYPPRRAGAIS